MTAPENIALCLGDSVSTTIPVKEVVTSKCLIQAFHWQSLKQIQNGGSNRDGKCSFQDSGPLDKGKNTESIGMEADRQDYL